MQHRIFYFFLIISLASCKVTKQINKAISNKPPMAIEIKSDEDSIKNIENDFQKFKSHYIDFKTFNAKLRIESSGNNGSNPDITAVVRIVKDSAIWISLSATFLNVEVYRALITKDSVILLNKQQKEVMRRSLSYLQEVTEIPLDYKTLENIIVGNPVFISNHVNAYKKTEKNILMSTITDNFKNLLTLTTNEKLLLHSKMDDIDLSKNRTADITYDGYDYSSGYYFSTNRKIFASEKKKIDLRLDFKQYEFNKDVSVSFSIPKNYLSK